MLHAPAKRTFLAATLVLATLALVPPGARAQPIAPDAPELAQPGPHGVGLRRIELDAGSASDEVAAQGGKLAALLWYPAQAQQDKPRTLQWTAAPHPWRKWSTGPTALNVPSRAAVDAPAAAPSDPRGWPVVVVSHGLLNWAEMTNYLGEHLASRGYVVLSIQHADERHADPLRGALARRPLDQWAAIKALDRLHATPADALSGRLQLQRVGVVGYSMGAYGALVAAGARVPSEGAARQYGPPAEMARHGEALPASDASLAARIAAVVAIAPWGGQSAVRAFDATSFAALKAPALVMSGDQDDISGYEDGVRRIWQQMSASPRLLLTYGNARHNIGLRGAPAGLPDRFEAWESFEEPVWRRDRIMDLNRHFITAFLDRHVRQDDTKAALLTPPAAAADPAAAPAAGKAGQAGAFGFQARWSVGVRLERLAPRE
jgi:predicted dienelactone hydrolase